MSLPQPVITFSGGVAVLAEPYEYQWELDGVRRKLVVPAGYEVEVSVPRWCWSLFGITPWAPDILPAAVCHDWIYEHQGALPDGSYWVQCPPPDFWHTSDKQWTRLAADRLFGRMMKENGVADYRRWKAYKAVRWFGYLEWAT